jgi:hypothetical protein
MLLPSPPQIPILRHPDKRESTVLIPSASNLLFLPQTSHVLGSDLMILNPAFSYALIALLLSWCGSRRNSFRSHIFLSDEKPSFFKKDEAYSLTPVFRLTYKLIHSNDGKDGRFSFLPDSTVSISSFLGDARKTFQVELFQTRHQRDLDGLQGLAGAGVIAAIILQRYVLRVPHLKTLEENIQCGSVRLVILSDITRRGSCP